VKVALVCPYAWDRFGGVQSHVRSLARALTRQGHQVTVAAPAMQMSADETLGSEVRRVGIAVRIPANGSVAPLAFGPVARSHMKSTLREIAPDVVHLHEPLIPSISLLALWSEPVAPTVGTFHAAAAGSVGYQMGRPLLETAAKRITVRTAVSDAARALVSRYFPGDYALTPNGIEAARFAGAEPLPLDVEGPKVVFFSRLEKRKGLEVLINAMSLLRDLGPTLVVAGTGPEERRCRGLARSLEVPALWLGRVQEDDVARLYAAADVYCAPSLGGESFGIVLAEAMASGAPVVCSDLDGYRAVVGRAASLAPPEDPEALAKQIRAVLADAERAKWMSEAGRERAQLYDWSRLVGNLEAIYERAAASGI
jgi:phosphatidyl-myo-inositol alpha-mannosyltransferase